MDVKHVSFRVRKFIPSEKYLEKSFKIGRMTVELVVDIFVDGRPIGCTLISREDDILWRTGVWSTCFYHHYWRELEMALADNHRYIDNLYISLTQQGGVAFAKSAPLYLVPGRKAFQKGLELVHLRISTCEG